MMKSGCKIAFYCFGFFSCFNAAILHAQSNESPWTDTQFPAYIKRLSYFGERPDWSHDGKKILFLGRSFGEAYELEVATGIMRPLTHHYYHGGYLRAQYLSNGDILLSGPKTFSPDNWQEGRFRLAELWVLNKNLDGPPTRLGEYCWEGPAVSRTQLKMVWAEHHGLYPSQNRLWQLWMGDINYENGKPIIRNQRSILDNSKGEVKDEILEPQNFIPGKEQRLTVQASNGGTEVMVLNIASGELTNCSRSPGSYDEPEGIFPDGRSTLVESSRAHPENRAAVDLWRLTLDSSAMWERVTYFTDNGKFKATNPVVSDDGKFIAFTVARTDEVAGIGHGIYLLDVEKYQAAQKQIKIKQ